MRQTIMGIDPGRINTGISVIKTDPHKVQLVSHIKTTGMQHNTSLAHIYNRLKSAIEKFEPDVMVYEKSSRNPDNVKVNTIIQLLAEFYEIPLHGYAPSTVKKEVTGNGKATKKEVEQAVRAELEMSDGKLVDHITDSLGCCVTYIKKELA